MFEEIYYRLKNIEEDKACFVESGSFYVVLGYEAEVLSEIMELEKTCFGNKKCKVGFPVLSLRKYMNVMEKLKIPYVIYGYSKTKDDEGILAEYKDKKWKKLAESEYTNKCIGEYILKNGGCNYCQYRKRKVVTDILACERRILNLKKELKLIEKVQANIEIKETAQIDIFDEEVL